MMDPRYTKLAATLVGHSTALQAGEKVLVEAIDVAPDLVVALIREIHRVGAVPLVSTKQNRVMGELYRRATRESMTAAATYEASRMRGVNVSMASRSLRSW